ncbi:MAG TPA: PKD domain-containing protein, partial [Blastocatellia bacterium]|nr:PKD domain-containing protein [Blastocatellia bacterium]
KNARRVLVDGNVFENNWVDGQNGTAILFTVRNQEGTAPWSAVEDVTFTNNILRHTAAGFLILGHDYNGTSQEARRILIRNNVMEDVGGSRWGTNGRLFDIESGTTFPGPSELRIDHNTAFHSGNLIVAGEYDSATSSYPIKPGFIYTNNLTRHNDYGVIGSNSGTGLSTLNNYFPGHVFQGNVMIGGPPALYPANNYFPASVEAVGFADYAGGNYRLALNSPYRNAGTDGRDVGADIDAIITAMGADATQPPNRPPLVSLTATPTQGVAPLPVSISVNASDSDGQVVAYRLECGDGHVSSGSTCSHTYSAPGTYTIRVMVTDNGGATATASLPVSVSEPVNPSPTNSVVLYAAEASVKAGAWSVVADQSAAGGSRIHNADSASPKLPFPLANPAHYFEMSFQAEAGRPYRLWVRGKAQNDHWGNDSVFVQFSDSVTSGGAAVYRIGSASGTEVNLEDCSGCGLSGWGWQDNGWGVGALGPVIYFQSSGEHRVRVQTREDGLSIDQIVLSSTTYLSASPGGVRNDTTILPKSGGGNPIPVVTPTITSVLPNTSPTLGGVPFVITGTNFAAGATVKVGGTPASNVIVNGGTSISAVAPAHAAGVVDVVVTNPSGQSATLTRGFTYVSLQPPTVAITASPLSGVYPLTVNFTSTASDPDGFIASYLWDFGNGQTSTQPLASTVYRSAGSYTARLTVRDNSGMTASASVVINVTTGTSPVVRVLTPNTRVTVRINSLYNITWSVTGASEVRRQEIYLSLDNGATWRVVNQELPANVTSYMWKVPKSTTQNARIKVVVRCYNGMSSEDTSDVSFIIAK